MICQCGCGASMAGWSDAGRVRGFRDGVPREFREAHGVCFCGRFRDQYGVCVHGELDRVGSVLAEFDLMPRETVERISHSHSEHGTYSDEQ